jgi:hypothetical protein
MAPLGLFDELVTSGCCVVEHIERYDTVIVTQALQMLNLRTNVWVGVNGHRLSAENDLHVKSVCLKKLLARKDVFCNSKTLLDMGIRFCQVLARNEVSLFKTDCFLKHGLIKAGLRIHGETR